MTDTKLIVRVEQSFYRQGLDVYMHDETDSVATNIVMERVPFGASMMPLLNLDKSAGQVLMDDLWKAGLRPTEGAGSAGSLAATQAHLGDMRKIVAAKLGVEL
jgi:hypothetical protein